SSFRGGRDSASCTWPCRRKPRSCPRPCPPWNGPGPRRESGRSAFPFPSGAGAGRGGGPGRCLCRREAAWAGWTTRGARVGGLGTRQPAVQGLGESSEGIAYASSCFLSFVRGPGHESRRTVTGDRRGAKGGLARPRIAIRGRGVFVDFLVRSVY